MGQYRAVEGVRPAPPQPLGLDRQAGRYHETVPAVEGVRPAPPQPLGLDRQAGRCHGAVPGRGGGEARPHLSRWAWTDSQAGVMRQYRAVEGVRPAPPQPLGLDRQAGRCHETVPGRGGGEARPTSAAGPGPTGRPVS